MPVDVAVEEPGSVVVRKEANRDIVPVGTIANAHNISDNRVSVVVDFTPSAADHMKGVPVQVNRVLLRGSNHHQFDDGLSAVANTHGSTNSTRGNGQLNALICFETIDAACRN